MKLYHDDNWLIFKIALLLGLTLFLSAWHFCDNVHAEVYYIDGEAKGELPKNTYLDFPLLDDVLVAKAGDIFFVSPSKTPYSPFIYRNQYPGVVTVMKSGIGDNPTIIPTGNGAAYCILQQADGLVIDGIHFDLSGCDAQASYFGWRSEWNAKDTGIYNCTISYPPKESFERNQTSKKGMHVTAIDANAKHAELNVTDTKFYNTVDKLSFEEKADTDSTTTFDSITKTVLSLDKEMEAAK